MELSPKELRWRCRLKRGRNTESEITLSSQERAVEAISTGLAAEEDGFNIFVVGTEGVGKKWLTFKKVQEKAKSMPVPDDWCYLHNFHDPKTPKAINLPPGTGRRFQEDMKNFVKHLREELPKAFESKEYESKAKEITERYNSQKEELLKQLSRMAEIAGFSVKFTPSGIALVPLMGGQLIPEEKLRSDPRLREFVDTKKREIDPIVSEYMKKLRDIDKKMNEELRKLREEVALFAITSSVEELKEKYANLPKIKEHIEEVKKDILKNIELFLLLPSSPDNPFLSMYMEKNLSRYEVNVIVDNSSLKHAPVVYEKNPTYSNLFGKIGARAEFGIYVTDFTQIVPGSVHRANGGFLILKVKDLLVNPGVWHTLKKVLSHREITVQPLIEELGLAPSASLLFKPEPIPLKLKVILIGDPFTFHLLSLLDPEFSRLFKIKAEFRNSVKNTPRNREQLSGTLIKLCENHRLLPLSTGALEALIEYSARLAGSRNRLSLNLERLLDIAREAHLLAGKDKSIKRKHIKEALRKKAFRSNLMEEILDDLIQEGTIIMEPEGKETGQIYGMAVLGVEGYSFGKPVRISATAYAGNKGIISIERESKLAGRIFEKAILTLSGYIGNRYGKDQPISLSASISFEQSYSIVEGDSATLAELLCLLSAISGMPLKQNIAVTGSVDQLGNVQPVGGINEKVEGFHRVCSRLRTAGGIIIPRRNINNLQLNSEVIDSVKKGDFKVFAVDRVDEAIEIAFDTSAKEVHQKVKDQLKEFHRLALPEERK